MRIRFLNPVEQVTGSCYWLRDDERDTEFLVDCGMVQGQPDEEEWNRRKFEFVPSKLKCVFLTHTHIDHCGLLPRLAAEGFTGPIYSTRESAELAKIALGDAAKQGAPYSQADVDRLKFREPKGRIFGLLHPFDVDRFFGFYRSSHIVGGVAIQIVWGPNPTTGEPNRQRAITFSGDLGCNEEGHEHLPLLRHRMRPAPADYAVVESTYGATVRSRVEKDFHARIDRLKQAVDRGLARPGVVLIPCFAIDRTQAVLFDLHYIFRADPDRYKNVPVFLSAPMAARVNEVYGAAMSRKEPIKANRLKPVWRNKRLSEWLDMPDTEEGEKQLEHYLAEILSSPNDNGHTRFNKATGRHEQRVRPHPDVIYTTPERAMTHLFERQPDLAAVVVTGSGMCNAGMVLDYMESLLVRESTTLILTGYLSPGTPGGQLLAHAKLPPEERRRSSEYLQLKKNVRVALADVKATIEKVSGYSGHADQEGLLDWLFSVHNEKPNLAGRTVFVTHGDEDQRRALRKAIEEKSAEWGSRYADHAAVDVHLPRAIDRGRWYDLDAGAWMEDPAARSAEDRLRDAEAEIAALREQLAKERLRQKREP